MLSINDPVVVAEVYALHEQYETALVTNDVETLTTFSWNSPHSRRFDVREDLYRDRKVFNVHIVAFGSDCAVVTLEFLRGERHGRESQVWCKFPEGWKIVSAHVSLMYETYTEQAASYIGLPIPSVNRDAVAVNLERASTIAAPVLSFHLTDQIQSATKFEP